MLRQLFLSYLIVIVVAGCGGSNRGLPATFANFIAVADIDGDGFLDVALSNVFLDGAPPHAGHIIVLFQNSAVPGTFLPLIELNVGTGATHVTLADLNADGMLDLISANSGTGSNSISVLIQDLAKPRSFLPRTDYAAATFPTATDTADMNGDGLVDIAVAASSLLIFFQDSASAGSFLPFVNIAAIQSSDVAIEDINADMRPDLVLASAGTTGSDGKLWVVLQDPVIAGNFLAPVSYSAGSQPSSVAIADLNADTRPDLAATGSGAPGTPGSATVAVLLQDSAKPGGFLGADQYAIGNSGHVVDIGDLNADNKPDLAVAHEDSVAVFLQEPAMAGIFELPVKYLFERQVLAVAIGDLNNDNLTDIAVAEDGAKIMYQAAGGGGVFLPPVQIYFP
jgi:hypothetical protein